MNPERSQQWRDAARELRERQPDMSYAEIARRLGVTPSAAWKALNPQTARESLRQTNARRRVAKRAWEREHDRGRCPCGNQTTVGAKRRGTRHCRECDFELRAIGRAMRDQAIYDLWHAGHTLKQIAALLDRSAAGVGVEIAYMRQQGWDMPYRRTPQRSITGGYENHDADVGVDDARATA